MKRLDLQGFLPYRLSILANRLSGALSNLYAEEFDLSIPEWKAVAVIAQYEDVTANQVCDITLMDKVSVSRAVTSLERKKLLTREVSKEDRRHSHLSLTKQGERMYGEIVPRILGFEKSLLSKLDAPERKELDRLLVKLLSLTEEV